ncbi:MAG: L-2-hydroxyglutarate oxidase [Thermoanaerobaculia bacterium]
MVGGGIVGLAVAREILRRRPGLKLALLEKESALARHQSGHNSSVIHSGVYYKPGSLKAKLCREGRRRLLAFCDEKGIPYRIDGKLVVAVEGRDLLPLAEIFARGQANGVEGIERIGPQGIREHEPHAQGLEAIWVPSAGVVDYREVAAALADDVRQRGGKILLAEKAARIEVRANRPVIGTANGPIAASKIVACAGLQSDRLAARAGVRDELRIVPFRGDYYLLRPEARHLIRSMINPVPDPRFPFLGVHFTRRIDGEVLAGPNAVLALAREGYGRFRVGWRDNWSTFTWPGFWRFAGRHWRTGVAEMWRDYVKAAYLLRLQTFVPEVSSEDLRPGPCGIRAQAVRRDGSLVDDFVIRQEGEVTHVVNAPSPAATSSLAIAREIVDRVEGPSNAGQ